MNDYKQTVSLKHNETLARVDAVTGEIIGIIPKRKNNIPEGKSLHKMDDFLKLNRSLMSKLKMSGLLSMEEIGVVAYMATIAEWNTNSLKPLNNDTSLRILSDFFLINKNRVKSVLNKLYKLGVYMQIKIYKDDEVDYWVLNPNISWKGSLSNDSLYIHFEGTTINAIIDSQ